MTTKIEKATALYKANKDKMSNGDIVKKIMKDLKMTEAGARTYAYNARKALGLTGTKSKVVKAKVKAKVDAKTGKLTVTKTKPDIQKKLKKEVSKVVSEENKAKNAKLFSDFHNKQVAANNEPTPYSPAETKAA